MTQEEKAKAYDEAIKKLRSLHDNYDTVSTLIDVKEELEDIFPELKESEDEMIRKALIKYYSFDKDGSSHALDNITPKQIVTWLEKQGEKFAAWSEEDEENSKNILYILNQLKGNAIYSEDKTAEKCIDWLKSLKDRVLPNQWKPSEEQMEALLSTLPVVKGGGGKVQTILESLYQDLKKLREE